MKNKLFIVGFFSLLNHAQIFDSNNIIPTVDESFVLSAKYEGKYIEVGFQLMPDTYIYLDKINVKDMNDSKIYFELSGNKKEKDDLFFGLSEIFDSEFKIKFYPRYEKKILLNFQGCYKNKVCYPNKIKNIYIKYDKKSISSVKIE